MAERGAGGYREEARGSSLKARRSGRGEEALALHGRGVLKVTMNVFVGPIFALAIFLSVYCDDSS